MDVGYGAVLGGTGVIDLTHPLTSTTQVYPSDPAFVSIPHATHGRDGYSVHKLVMGTHTGTHIDAPCHFVEGGRTIDEIDLANLIGEAAVIDLSTVALNDRQRIEWSQIKDKLSTPGTRILIIYTGWSKAYYQSERYLDHPYLAADIASHLLAQGVTIVAVDTLNPDETPKPGEEEGADGFSFHERYLGGGGLIVENLTNLDYLLAAQAQQPEARWIVSFIPLKLSGLDGSPIRAFASRT